MKPLTLLFAIVFLVHSAFAEGEHQQSDLEAIIRAMAEQYAKSRREAKI